jgi:hypothetical protein
MRMAVWLGLILWSGSCFAQPAATCPWLSTGSAAEALGGALETDVQIENSTQGTCRFIRGSGNDQESIEISIGKIDTHVCPPASPKKVGLGNEAVQCRMAPAGRPALEMITGRVRDVYFVVGIRNAHEYPSPSWETMHRGDPEPSPVLDLIAEQVVGNLY